MAEKDDDDDDHHQGGGASSSASTNPAITYTRTRKTKTAASSTRRRHNIPLCHASDAAASGRNSEKSWFARKAAGWTDDEIRSHLVSGGTSGGGGSLSMEGDLIQGIGNNSAAGRNKKRNERNNNKRRLGPRFAWEEEEDKEDYDTMHITGQEKSIMRAAPTLQDIMDEQDQIDLLAPQKVGKDYQSSGNGDNIIINDHTRPNRRTNAALAEIAQFFDNNASNADGTAVIPTAATDSIGWRLLRVLGYRSRLGMAFVSLPGFSAGKDDDNDQANDLESMHLPKNLSAKHLASKGLRAIRLPSVAQDTTSSNETAKKQTDSHSTKQVKVLAIPPPKINKHGIGYDPFKNAPEFRAFHKKREALAKKRGRAADNNNDSRSTAYFTDNLRRDERQRLWDKNRDDSDDDKNKLNQRASNQQDDGQHMNYAAHDYTDFIGTKASSGFALEDEDDTNVYQDDEHDYFPKSNNNRSGYYLEIPHSPVASDDEDDDKQNGLFHHSVAVTSVRKPSAVRKSGEDGTNVADAWDSWGMGKGDSLKAVTSDGKPPLPGFQLGQQINNDNNFKRWPGPMVPSGYVLRRHVFLTDDRVKTAAAYTVNNSDCGLGLDLQSRKSQRPFRSTVPTVLPHSEHQQQSVMRARNGTELDFNAVKESMKNRFVSSSGDGNVAATTKSDAEEDTTDKEEWINVTSTSWIPTRLLCKRWGIPLPSTSGAASSTTANTERVSATGEEAYFHETVLPKQKGGEESGRSIMGTDTKNREEEDYLEETVDGDIVEPPPNRPSNDVFKSIFDASSDMDISSSEEEEGEEEVQGEVEESGASEMHMKINSITSTPAQEPVAERSSSSSSESEDSRQQSRKHRLRREDRHRRKKTHRRRSPSISPDSRASDDYYKRRKKKKKRHKRSHSHSRHKEKRRR